MESTEKIEFIVITRKGNNFEAQFDCSVYFSDSGSNMIKSKCQELKNLLLKENDEQTEKNYWNNQKTSKANLNDFL